MSFYQGIFIFLTASTVFAANSYRVNNGANTNITEHGVCKNVANASGKDIFVPTKTGGEWNSFVANPPPNVTITGTYAAPTVQTLAPAERRHYGVVNRYSGLQVDDLMIALAYKNGVFSCSPAGWTALDSNYNFSGTYYSSKWYKFATSADVAASTFDFFTPCATEGLMMNVIRGANKTATFDGHTVNTTSGATTISFTAFTTTHANVLLLAMLEGGSIMPDTPPSNGFSSLWSSAADLTVFASKTHASPSSTGTIDGTSSSSNAMGASLIGIVGLETACP